MRKRTCESCLEETTKVVCTHCGAWLSWVKPAIIVGVVLFVVLVLAASKANKQRAFDAGSDSPSTQQPRPSTRTTGPTTKQPTPRSEPMPPPSSDSGPNCVKGKRCGNSCIAMNKTCHK